MLCSGASSSERMKPPLSQAHWCDVRRKSAGAVLQPFHMRLITFRGDTRRARAFSAAPTDPNAFRRDRPGCPEFLSRAHERTSRLAVRAWDSDHDESSSSIRSTVDDQARFSRRRQRGVVPPGRGAVVEGPWNGPRRPDSSACASRKGTSFSRAVPKAQMFPRDGRRSLYLEGDRAPPGRSPSSAERLPLEVRLVLQSEDGPVTLARGARS